MNENILIINDEEDVRDMIRMFLQEKNYKVIEASDGHQGIQKAEEFQPDLILLDIVMPIINGYETCQALKLNPKTSDIPVIFLSSLADVKDKVKGLEIGAVDFVSRTGDRAELIARVETHLKISSLTRELKDKNQQLIQKQKFIDDDLQVAAEIQRSLLPSARLNLPHLDIAWKCSPCALIGGDIFNIIPIDSHTVFYMLDVSGHGVASALITVSISEYFNKSKSTTQEYLREILSPSVMLKNLNKEFPFDRFEEFFTIFYMVLDNNTNELTFGNSGHPPAILLHTNDDLQLLETHDTVVGIGTTVPIEKKIQLKKNDKIVLYTDGVTECINSNCELYGEQRLLSLLASVKHLKAKEIVEAVFADLINFSQNVPYADDISLLVVTLL